MKTRFDLEEDILRCWKVVDDLREIGELLLPEYYNTKFETLWDTFTEVFQIDDYAPTREDLESMIEASEQTLQNVRDGKEVEFV